MQPKRVDFKEITEKDLHILIKKVPKDNEQNKTKMSETDVHLCSLLQHSELNGGKKNYKTFGKTTQRQIIYKTIRNLKMSKSSSPIWHKYSPSDFQSPECSLL